MAVLTKTMSQGIKLLEPSESFSNKPEIAPMINEGKLNQLYLRDQVTMYTEIMYITMTKRPSDLVYRNHVI
jgi:hypothetical protein